MYYTFMCKFDFYPSCQCYEECIVSVDTHKIQFWLHSQVHVGTVPTGYFRLQPMMIKVDGSCSRVVVIELS